MSRRDEQRAEAKEKILAAAAACFAEKGYAGCTIQDIADRAGVSKGALYVYYSSKEELFKAMIGLQYDMALDRSRASRKCASHLSGVIWFMSECIRNCGFPMDHRLWAEILAVAARDAHIKHFFMTEDSEMRCMFARQLQRGVLAGEIDPDLDLNAVAIWLTALGDGLIIRAAADPDFDFQQHLPVFEKLVRRALVPG